MTRNEKKGKMREEKTKKKNIVKSQLIYEEKSIKFCDNL